MENLNDGNINLDKNESYFFLNEKILSELKSFDEKIITTYPNIHELTELIAQHSGHPMQKILPCHGSEQSIRLIIMNLLNSEDRVILLSPTFVAFDYALEDMGIKPIIINYQEEQDKYVAPIEKIISSIDEGVKCIMLCNPSNPLGCTISEFDLQKIIQQAHKFNALVIVDEVYSKFSGISCNELVKKFDNLIILRSFSKEYGLAGIRLGYLIAAPEIIKKLDNARRMFWPVSHFALHALKVILRNIPHFDEQIRITKRSRNELILFLREIGLKCYSSETNFFIVKSEKKKEIMDYLASKKIFVGDVDYFKNGEHLLQNAFRISVPSPDDKERLIEHFISLRNNGVV
jgi:histidinol-phosphate aminotransferase